VSVPPVFADNAVTPAPGCTAEPVAARAARRPGRLRRAAYWLGVLVLGLLSAEVTARLGDWLYKDIPFLATPDADRDLVVQDENGNRGKPHGQFKKWRLNGFGFRGPEIERLPAPGTRRVMILGASETLGYFESEGKEFPAQLAELLGSPGPFEVINTAIAGMTVNGMIRYWHAWLASFKPDVVVIYPPPLFYLHEPPPWGGRKAKAATAPKAPEPAPLRSRLVFRLKDMVHMPAFIDQWRTRRQVAALLEGKSDDWVFRSVPQDRLDHFVADVAELARTIEQSGARPVLLTHAIRAANPPRPEDHWDLFGMRVHLPRASEEVMVAFEEEVAQRVRALASQRGWPLVDVAARMNGRREWFADLVHFNDEGAGVIAGLVAEQLRQLAGSLRPRTQAAPAVNGAIHGRTGS
jgi:lysophospholipase L1-like esterase